MKKIFIVFIFSFIAFYLKSATVDTIVVHSNAMNKDVKTIVVYPESENDTNFPTVYMLHGHGGNELMWSRMVDLNAFADNNKVIIVCPDGGVSWYWDSPINPSSKYETFISKELPAYIDSNYSTIPSKDFRAITGLSMGGHGALWNAIRNKDVFAAAGSMSGGVDIRPFPENWNMKKSIGSKTEYPQNWEDYTVINQTDSLKSGELAMIIDCGYDDFFFEVNNNFHDKLMSQGIAHDYIVRPGKHNAEYWKNAIYYQMEFFRLFFDNAK